MTNPALDPNTPSPVIKGVSWAPASSIIRLAKGKGTDGSDIWATTWADDGDLYTAYGDGYGFDPMTDEKLSMGFARVAGVPPHIQGFNIRSKTGETRGYGRHGGKPSGMLMVDGVLYLMVRNMDNAQLAWSTDHARTWTWADWKFTTSFGCPTFINFGPDYAGSRDSYVYIISPDSPSAYLAADRMVMARVPKDRIKEQEAYEYFVKVGDDGVPVWSPRIEDRGAVIEVPGKCYRSGVSYNPGLKRYLWTVITPNLPDMQERGRREDMRFRGGFRIYDAPEPWGPWTKVFETPEWDVGPGDTSCFPTKWMSTDGRVCYLLFAGDDRFSVRQVTFEVEEPAQS